MHQQVDCNRAMRSRRPRRRGHKSTDAMTARGRMKQGFPLLLRGRLVVGGILAVDRARDSRTAFLADSSPLPLRSPWLQHFRLLCISAVGALGGRIYLAPRYALLSLGRVLQI